MVAGNRLTVNAGGDHHHFGSRPRRRARATVARMRWPLLFGLQPCNVELLDHADYVYDLSRDFDAPGEIVFKAFFNDALADEVSGLRGFTWHTAAARFDSATVDEMFSYMSLRMRTVSYVPNERLAMSIDRCSLPLGRQMLQMMEAKPRSHGGCRLRWRIAVRYLPGTASIAPAVRPVFRRMFEQTLSAVERQLAARRH